ncbi:MAG: hypothetical protein SWC96_05550 [Thermodesulfobacteriota bacterium]|nr:hypothetical protein [Thermodesulfobacteriota bacterium]
MKLAAVQMTALLGRTNLVVGGSCWWDLPEARLPGFMPAVREKKPAVMRQTPARFVHSDRRRS